MGFLADHVTAAGGFCTTRELRQLGATDKHLTAATRFGELERVRNGWYSTLPTHDPRLRAIRVGGKLTGLSALHELGAWMWSEPARLHVAVADNAARLRMSRSRRQRMSPGSDPTVAVHWEPKRVLRSSSPWSVSVIDALRRVILDESLETAVIALDWALSTGQIDRAAFEGLIASLPAEYRAVRSWVDPASQSILETASRVRLLARGFHVRSQVGVGTLQSIDLVVQEVVALEVDGRAHHESAFESDRLKDLYITTEGRHSIRPSANHVRFRWPLVLLAVETAVAARLGAAALPSPPRLQAGNSGHPANPDRDYWNRLDG